MSPEAGWVDEETDTRVEKVTEDTEEGTYRVQISVPKLEKEVEEVLVIGEKEEQQEKPGLQLLPVRFEVINDLDQDRSGIIVYIGEMENFKLRINYHDGSQDILPRPVGEIRP